MCWFIYDALFSLDNVGIIYYFKTVHVIKFYMWIILNLSYERWLNYVQKKMTLFL